MKKDLLQTSEFLLQLGEQIKNLRKERNIKGEVFGRELGVTKAAVSQMENGQMDFKISTLLSIASVLGTDIATLMNNHPSIESDFNEYRFKTEQHLRTLNLLVCRIEYLNEQISYSKSTVEDIIN